MSAVTYGFLLLIPVITRTLTLPIFICCPALWTLQHVDSSLNTDPQLDQSPPKEIAVESDHDVDAKRYEPKPQAQNPNSDSFVFVSHWPKQRGVDLTADIMTSLFYFSKMRCMILTIQIGRRRSLPYNLSALALPSILVDTAAEVYKDMS